MSNNMVPGMRVYFGRREGEKTLGKIVKVNGKSVKVEQLESRGTLRDYKVGTIWRVALSFVTPADGAAVETTPAAPVVRRPEAEIMSAIRRCYSELSPENLSCDGELSVSDTRRRGAAIRSRLRTLFAELGRQVSEDEAYRTA